MQITTKLVPDSRRLAFLPKHFGPRAMSRVEGRVFDYAAAAIEGYSGDYWEFVEATNGAGFLFPSSVQSPQCLPGQVRLRPTAFMCSGGVLSREAAGLALTVLAVNHEWNRRPEDEVLPGAWEQLMELARKHPERDTLLTILD